MQVKIVATDFGIEFQNSAGKAHRVNGPATFFADGTLTWRIAGKFHNPHGPAVLFRNGCRRWYLDGYSYSEKTFHQKVKELQCKL